MDLHLRYDVALLRLSSNAALNSYVQLAYLPPANQILPNNNLCYITGWGRTSSESIATSGHSVSFYAVDEAFLLSSMCRTILF